MLMWLLLLRVLLCQLFCGARTVGGKPIPKWRGAARDAAAVVDAGAAVPFVLRKAESRRGTHTEMTMCGSRWCGCCCCGCCGAICFAENGQPAGDQYRNDDVWFMLMRLLLLRVLLSHLFCAKRTTDGNQCRTHNVRLMFHTNSWTALKRRRCSNGPSVCQAYSCCQSCGDTSCT